MSKSRVLNYINCPQKFEYDYIFDMRFMDDEPEEGSPLRKGSELHKIFEDYYTIEEAKNLPTASGTDYVPLIYDLLIQHPFAKKEDPELREEYFDHLANFAEYNASEIVNKGIENYIPAGTELDLYDKCLDFQGIIDRVEEKSDGTYTLIDYKTGRPGTLKKYWLELVLYKVLFEKATKKRVTEVGIWFSKNGKLRVTKDISLEDDTWALRILSNVRQEIDSGLFPKKRSFLCRYCNYLGGICDTPADVYG
ncbi:MAG: PD-(D/E)XK nuclease family protein [Candidatus Subteraquimicrobiales bacterium]|nr:PD-(D/E)XK nuclease family protein [Candidatus Subteraquimicrobiales bacterium]